MANGNNGNPIIQIKRSQNSASPTSLSNGEIAYSFSSDRLFIGETLDSNTAPEVTYIGGKLLVDKVANLESVLLSGSGSPSFQNLTVDKVIFNTHTDNAVLFTKPNGEVDSVTGISGSIMQISSNGAPSFGTLDGGTF